MTLTSYENSRSIICRSVALHRFVNHVITLMKNDKEELTEEYQVRKQHDIHINHSYMNSNKIHMRSKLLLLCNACKRQKAMFHFSLKQLTFTSFFTNTDRRYFSLAKE